MQCAPSLDKINRSFVTKRTFDMACAALGLLGLSPLLLACAVAVRMDSPGAIIFKQIRVGKGGKPFTIYKFRTMTQSPAGTLLTTANDARITRVGAFMRRYKFDEMPQLWNVLKGEMSIVGPRPEVPKFVAFYPEASKAMVLSVPPGMTDFASLRYIAEEELLRASVDPERTYVASILPRKLSYCRFYVRKRSLLLDLKLIQMTLKAVVGKRAPQAA